MILSGEPMPSDRKRHRDQDPVMIVPDNRPAPPVPAPSAVDLLAELVERIEAAEQRAAEREERAIARHQAVMRRLSEISDEVHSTDVSVEMAHKDLLWIAGVTDPAAD